MSTFTSMTYCQLDNIFLKVMSTMTHCSKADSYKRMWKLFTIRHNTLKFCSLFPFFNFGYRF